MNDTKTQVKVTKEILAEVEKIRGDMRLYLISDERFCQYFICHNRQGALVDKAIVALAEFGRRYIPEFYYDGYLGAFNYNKKRCSTSAQYNAAKLDHLNKFIQHYKDKV